LEVRKIPAEHNISTRSNIADVDRYFLIFIFLDVIFFLGVYFYFPETANTPLEEVAKLFGDEVAVTLEDAGNKDVDKAAEFERVEMVEDVHTTPKQKT
jgi:hypothetical protein